MDVRKRKTNTSLGLSAMVAELGVASAQVIMRRTMMIATGACSPAEYRRMVGEKAAAVAATSLLLVKSGGRASPKSLLAPWHARATANAKRLRRS
jgi:hypothetical protein